VDSLSDIGLGSLGNLTVSRAVITTPGIPQDRKETAFNERLIEQLSAFLAGNGIEVLYVARMAATFDFLHAIPTEKIRQAAVEAMAEALEVDLGVPVIAQNHSDFWEPLRALKINDVSAGHGRLLDSLRTIDP
jgi:maleate cis-trans isomerase